MRHHRAERLFGDGLRQNDVGVAVLERAADGGELRAVVGERVALSALIGGHNCVGVLESQRCDVQVVLV